MSFQGDLLNGWPEDGEPDMSTLYKVSTENIGRVNKRKCTIHNKR